MVSDRMRLGLAWGIALALALAVLGAIALFAGTPTAGAQAGFTVTPEQLKVNQNISSAAVKRSNRSLNYLAPIRTTATDNADDGSNGVKALSTVTGSGAGWTIAQLAPGQKQYWINVGPTGTITSSSGPAAGTTGAFTVTRSGAGDYVVDFKTNVSTCSWVSAPYYPSPPGTPFFSFAVGVPGQVTQVNIRTFNATPVAADSNFTVQVLC